MHASQETLACLPDHNSHRLPMQQIEPYSFSNFHDSNDDLTHGKSQGTGLSFQAYAEQFYTLESTPATDNSVYSSPSAVSVSSNRSPLSPQVSHSYMSDHHHSSDNTYGSSLNSPFGVDDEDNLHALWTLSSEFLGPEFDIDYIGSSIDVGAQPSYFNRYGRILEMAPNMDLKQLLIACAEVVSEADIIPFSERKTASDAAETLMDMLEKKVSVSGDPLQRLGAYMLEALRARLLSSGSLICKKLKCNEPSGPDLMSHMQLITQICPYYKFAYMSANIAIGQAMEGENRIHIIDFQIAQGSQWVSFIQAISRRPGGPPFVRITGVDDSESAHARGGGLQLVSDKLAQVAKSCGVPFEFHGAAVAAACDVQLEDLQIRHGEAVAANFPYILHHVPDESVSPANHRDRLLRLVKSLSPKVVALVEQESNTNTSAFSHRFRETLDYYTAMFESIDAAALSREEKQRINAEEHCVAKDVVNMIACEGDERVERHELFGKWRLRLTMAGFSQIPVSSLVCSSVRDMLRDYSPNYAVAEGNGALCIRWKNRALVTFSAWR